MSSFLGQGVYTPAEAARLTGVAARRIRRWFEGYRTTTGSQRPAVVPEGARTIDGQLQLSFLDLIEIRLIDAFLQEGVGWKELRTAAQRGAELFHTSHPFSSYRFQTDGRRLFARLGEEGSDQRLVRLLDQQHFIRDIMTPLLRDVEFDTHQAIRWWPIGERYQIIVDPKICFGKPAGWRSGVPAEILAVHAKNHGVRATCRWYEVEPIEVRGALRLASRLAA